MKVLNVIWKFGPGGINKCFQTYARMGQIDSSVEVVSVCIDPQNCDYDRSALFSLNVSVIKIKTVRDLSWIKSLNNIIQKSTPDLIFTHGLHGAVVCQLVKSKYGLDLPLICSFHSVYQAPTKIKKILEPVYNNIQPWLYKKFARKVILVCNYSKKDLLKKNVPDQLMVTVHNGIPLTCPTVRKQLPYKGISIGIACRLDFIKGIEYLIEAVSIVKQMTSLPFHIYIVGEGPLKEELEAKRDDLSLKNDVSFMGYQSNVSEWLNAWDIFCLPSLSECHSIALLEAMRAGKAIIATNVGGNEESVTAEKEALIIPPRNSQKLAEAMLRLIESERLRTRLGNQAKLRFQSEFTEEISLRNLIKVLKNTL